MKGKLFVILVLSVLATFQSCKKSPLTIGKTVTETRSLPDFKDVRLNDNVSMSLVRSDKNCIQITTGENIIDNITTEVRDSVLTICNTTTFDWTLPYDYELHATLYFKDIRNFHFASSGNLNTENQYNSNDTSVRKCRVVIDGGSGDIDMLVNNCRGFYLEYLYGTSHVTIHGENNRYFDIFHRSYGIMDARNFKVDYVDIHSKATGDCYIHACDSIKAKIENLGYIYYKGDPGNIQVTYGEFAKGKLLPL